jgi:hypothetical protein
MIIAHLIVALVAAGSALVLLWPAWGIAALALAPFAASAAVVLVAGLVSVFGAAPDREPASVPADPLTPP